MGDFTHLFGRQQHSDTLLLIRESGESSEEGKAQHQVVQLPAHAIVLGASSGRWRNEVRLCPGGGPASKSAMHTHATGAACISFNNSTSIQP